MPNLNLTRRIICSSSAGGGSAPFVGPLDTIPGALLAWGLVPLAASRIGQNAFQLQKTSGGATQDFVFEDTGTPTATAEAWKGADPAYNNRSASFATIYDQVGTNHLTQATQTAQPSWLKLPDGTVVAAMNGNNLGRNAFFSIPNASWTSRNLTVYHVVLPNERTSSIYPANLSQGHLGFGWNVTGGYTGNFAGATSDLSVVRQWAGPGYTDSSLRLSNCHPQVIAARYNGTNSILSVNGGSPISSTIQPNGTLTSGSIGRLGAFTGVYSQQAQWLATLIYPAQTDEQMATTTAALQSRFSLASWTHNVVFGGDSITAGHQENEGYWDVRYKAWPFEMWGSLNRPAVRFANVAISSETLATMETAAAQRTDTAYISSLGANNILVTFAGTNDIHFGADAVTTIARLETYIASRRSAGFSKHIFCTAIPREPFNATQNGYLATYNAFITANTLGADAVVDLAALSWDFATHYQGATPNRIHPNEAGRTLIANAVQTALASIL